MSVLNEEIYRPPAIICGPALPPPPHSIVICKMFIRTEVNERLLHTPKTVWYMYEMEPFIHV